MVEPVSLMECMLNCGVPISTVSMPNLADIMGPIVEPHVQSFFTIKSCRGTSAKRAASLKMLAVTVFVAYLLLQFLYKLPKKIWPS